MKGTDNFKNVIFKYLTDRAEFDTIFAEQFVKEGKNIDDCIAYILNVVKSSGSNGFEDDEVFKMAVDYYEAGYLEKQVMPQVNIVTNHKVELTDADLAEIKQKAINEAIAAKRKQITAKTSAKKTDSQVIQASLF